MEQGKGRQSPRKGSFYDAFPEIYGIKELLDTPNLSLLLVRVDIEEYRLLNGWSRDKKKGSVCHDRKPKRVCDVLHICCTDDYKALIPENLGNRFSSKDFAKVAKINLRKAQIALNVLKHVNAVQQVSKQGNLLIYERMI